MSGEVGAPGTAGDGFRVPVKEGRHRAPPEPPPPDRFTPPIAAAAAILTAASLIALYAPGIAPDATAAGRHGLAVSTAARSARTVHVPLTVLPATPPTIGAEGAWDPEANAPIPLSAPRPWEPFAGATGTATAPQTPNGELVATTTPLTTTRLPTTLPVDTATAARTTTSPSPTTDAAASTTSSATPTEEPTVTPTSSAEPTPTDVIGDVLDEVLEDALGETP